MTRATHPPAVYVVRWGDLWKAGSTTRRRWRSFLCRGAELVNVTYYPTGGADAAEALVDGWLAHLGHQAFATKSDAVPFLGNQGAGWLECLCLCAPRGLTHPITSPSHTRSLLR